MTNFVYIATSLDGYIADRDGGLDWLHSIPNPEQSDFGWADFIAGIDAIVMGRNTFETVCGFAVPWPYSVPVFVLSHSLNSLPEEYRDRAQLISGSLCDVMTALKQQGFNKLYIDGGKTIQGFMRQDLIDELIVTQIPIVLGAGIPLYGELPTAQRYELVRSEVMLGAMVKNHYRRLR
ncbi:dihydrofolate reductase family protein [Dongshaea marina]|uniref:dihydrofolate reductase family protein n=1 Tax=Dongshaea marina TaxID=2047966 RepID=UPI000D3ECDDB|nr:dihydrofolate reductase family protein [Dongshaea marina]